MKRGKHVSTQYSYPRPAAVVAALHSSGTCASRRGSVGNRTHNARNRGYRGSGVRRWSSTVDVAVRIFLLFFFFYYYFIFLLCTYYTGFADGGRGKFVRKNAHASELPWRPGTFIHTICIMPTRDVYFSQ